MRIKSVIGIVILIMSISMATTVSFAEDTSTDTTTQTYNNAENNTQDISETQDSEKVEVIDENQEEKAIELNLRFDDFTTSLLNALESRENAVDSFQTVPDKIETMKNALQIAQTEYDLLEQYYIPDDTTRPVEGNVAINRWMLQKCYMDGLKMQCTASIDDEEAFVSAWEKGYQYRMHALEEMSIDTKLYESGVIPEYSIISLEAAGNENCEENSYLVYMVQALLGVKIDGEFGNGSKVSLKDYQLAHGLIPNAILDESVLVSLMETKEETDLDNVRKNLVTLSANSQLGITEEVSGDIVESFDKYRSNLMN